MTERDLQELVLHRHEYESHLVSIGMPYPVRPNAEVQMLRRWREGKHLAALAHALSVLESLGVRVVIRPRRHR